MPVTVASLLAACVSAPLAAQDDYERPPISYSDTAPDNRIESLQRRLDSGAVRLAFDAKTGYLRSVLAELSVPPSSQTLVFSKTSLQQHRIAPRNPRALYFNDDVYVGYVRTGNVLEVSVADPALGTVFYSLEQTAVERPRFVRHTDDCLICHGGSQTRGVPGHIIRSVYPDRSGQPIFSAGSHRVDHTTPFKHRWGGWYVTGSHGSDTHLGNITFASRPEGDVAEDTSGLNVTDVGDRFRADGYLSSASDLVALLVLTHQTHAHNVITRASFDARTALYREAALNRELKEPAGNRWPSTDTILDGAAASLVECFLFCDEAALKAPVKGTTDYAREFMDVGPKDGQGRSLRTLDLRTRLFRHPCSFLVSTASFDALPEELLRNFWRRMDLVLSGGDRTGKFGHLSADDQAAIREILIATKPGVSAFWRKDEPAPAE
jgi:hypothetical protein